MVVRLGLVKHERFLSLEIKPESESWVDPIKLLACATLRNKLTGFDTANEARCPAYSRLLLSQGILAEGESSVQLTSS